MFKCLQSAVSVAVATCLILLCSTPTAAAVRLLPHLQEEVEASLPRSLDTLLRNRVVSDGTKNFNESYLDLPSDILFVVTPGTEDLNLTIRLGNLIGSNPVAIIEYDESFWPVMAGKSGAISPIFAPTFDASRRQAIMQNLRVMRALQDDDGVPHVLYTGYSQGAVALGDAVEEAVEEGLLGERDYIYLTSDGRGPWGILPGLQALPFMELVLLLLGISPDGARNPADMAGVRVTDVIVTADSIANFQWKEDRVEESIFINILGYVVCHGDPVCYGDLNQHGPPTYLESVEGDVTYEIYHSLHPVTMLYLRICSFLQLTCGDTGTAIVDWLAQSWYEIEVPSIKGAAVPVRLPERSAPSPVWQPPMQNDGEEEGQDGADLWSPPSETAISHDVTSEEADGAQDNTAPAVLPEETDSSADEIETPVVAPTNAPLEAVPTETQQSDAQNESMEVALGSQEVSDPATTQAPPVEESAVPIEVQIDSSLS